MVRNSAEYSREKTTLELEGYSVDILFEDEAHFYLEPSLKKIYSPDPFPVKVQSYMRQERESIFGTVNMLSGQIVLASASRANRYTFINYLRYLQEEYYNRDFLFIFVDGARYHRFKDYHYFLLDKRPVIEFVFLPPYSPELNPAEFIWKLVRKDIADVCYFDLYTLISDIFKVDHTFRPTLCKKYQNLLQR